MRNGPSKLASIRTSILGFAAAAAVALSMVVLPSASVASPDVTIDEAKQKVNDAYRQAEQATERYHEITDEVSDTKSEIKALRKDVAREQKAYDALRADVGEIVASKLTNSPMGPTAKLLTTEDPEEFIDGLSALQSYSSHQENRLREFEQAAKQLKVRKDRLDSKLAVIEDAEKRIAKEKKEVDQRVDEAKSVLAKLTAEQRERIEAAEERRAEEQAAQAEAAGSGDDGGQSESDGGSSDGGSSGGDSSGGGSSIGNVDASGRALQAIDFAMAQLGEPYVYGATGPNSWDCSGLTGAAWAAAGVSLPRSSSQQAGAGQSVSTSSMSPGDLVFYYSPISHVGIYLGNGKLLHAPNPSSSVSIVPVDSMPISTVRRVG